MWQHVLCVNVTNACQLLICACQRANKRANVAKLCQLFNLEYQRAKGVPIFQLFSKRTFQFLNFSIMSIFATFKNIWAILQNLSRETKNSNFDFCKISLIKNLVNLKPLTSFSMEDVGLTEQLFG